MMQKASITVLAIILNSAYSAAQNTACAISSGQSGLCVATSSCSSSGGISTAGFCAGASDIQCCTYGSCTASGSSGLCQPTASCTGKSTAGVCPGAADIECCTKSSGTSCGAPAINQATLTMIEGYEGWSATPYLDPVGNPTIGYGHLCSTTSCSEIPYPIPLSLANGVLLLDSDTAVARNCITADISSSVTLNVNQYGALVDWAFNVGCGNAASSTLIKELNEGEDPDTVAAQQLPLWDEASGVVLPGLVARRAAEVTLFKTASSTVALPVKC